MSRRRNRILLTLAAVALGILVRLNTLPQTRGDGRVRVISPDCAYHLRRARFAVKDFPRTIQLDPMINFPDGGLCIWPPLFDLALAAPARLLGGRAASTALFERGAAIVPLLFAALAIAAAGLAGLTLRARFGVAAALFLALCTGHVHYSQFAQTDQHVAESCWGFGTLALFLASTRRRSPTLEIASGVCLAAAVLTWQGAIFWAPLLAGAIVAGARSHPAPRALRRSLGILGVPALIVAAATAYWLHGFSPPFTYISFGWFQPVFLAATFLAAQALILIGCRHRPLTRGWLAAALAAGAAALGLIVPFASRFLVPLREGVLHLASRSSGSAVSNGGFLSYSKEWLAQIAEYRPLFADAPWLSAELLSLAFLLAPLVVLLWGVRALRGCRPEFHAALFLWGGFTFFIAVMQRRNMYYAALLGAAAAVELASQAAFRLARKLAPVERRRAPLPIFAAVVVAVSLPMLTGLRKEVLASYVPGADLWRTLSRLRQIVPHALDAYDSRFLRPGVPIPERDRAWAVMAPWSLGHWITYESEVPVAADNFGYGFQDSIRFFLSEHEDEALRIAAARRCRYVLAADLSPKMNDYAAVLGRPPFAAEGTQGLLWTPRYFESVQARLYEFDGAGARLPNGVLVRPLAHFRLLYASTSGEPRFGRFVARWKIFEILPDQKRMR